MFSKLLVAMAVAVVAVNAQGSSTASAPSTIPSLSPCVAECLTLAARADGCVSFTNATCACTNTQFQADAGFCYGTNCSPVDAQAALAFFLAECSAAGLSPAGPSAAPSSLPFTPPASTASANASAASSLASADSFSTAPTGSSAAVFPSSSPSFESLATSLVANGRVAAIVAMIVGFLAI